MIWRQEVKKLLKHPLLWCLLFVFMVWNLFLVFGTLGVSGAEGQDYHEIQEEIQRNGINEEYFKEKRGRYDTLDMLVVRDVKKEMFNYYPTGSYQEFIDERYEKLNLRVKEIIETKEADGIVYPGDAFRLHTKLYVTVLRTVFAEMSILVLFAVLFIMDYERMNRTIALTYSCKIGRKLQLTKWCAGTFVGICFGVVLLAGTLFLWFLLVPYQGFWDISVSAALMTEPRGIFHYPYVTFHKMTIAQYLAATVAMGMVLVVIIGLIAGVIQTLVHNSYLALACVAMFLMTGLWISGIGTATWLDVVLAWNPTDLWYRMGNWFMEGSLVSSFEGAEIICVCVQIGFWSVIGGFAYRRFLRKDW